MLILLLFLLCVTTCMSYAANPPLAVYVRNSGSMLSITEKSSCPPSMTAEECICQVNILIITQHKSFCYSFYRFPSNVILAEYLKGALAWPPIHSKSSIYYTSMCIYYTSMCIYYTSMCIYYTSMCIYYTSMCIYYTSMCIQRLCSK